MPENFNQHSPEFNKLEPKIRDTIFQRIKDAMKKQPVNIDTTALRQWMKTATKTQIEEKLAVLQAELMEFYQKGEPKNKTSSDKEKKLREEIKILDDYLLNY
jgi:hypothetical protein